MLERRIELLFSDVAVYLGTAAPDDVLRERTLALMAEAPLSPRGVWMRGGARILYCGTIGGAFDTWQRRLSFSGSADQFIAQAIGTAAVEKVMDAMESEAAASLLPGETLKPRRSPGYGRMPLSMNTEIIRFLAATVKTGVSCTDAMLLVPSKSVTAVAEIVSCPI